MRAVVLSIGSELLRGDIVDSNAAFLTRQLSQLGFQVRRVVQVGDDLEVLTGAVSAAIEEAEVVLCTGGLGPTQDDLTREAIAAAVGEEMYCHEQALRVVEGRFASMGRRMPASNRRQAMLIPSAESIPNPHGTAPGWFVRTAGKAVAAMPGPPSEMEPMWRDSVEPRVETLLSGAVAMLSLMTFGLGESAVEERVEEVIRWRPDVTVATYAKAAGVEVHITARASSEEEAARLLGDADHMVRARLGEAIYGTGDDTLPAAVGRELERRGLSLAVMESATGGTVASMVTDQQGSSAYFRGGIVSYSRESKERFGVDAHVVNEHGLISPETALAMARAVRHLLGADVGLGLTGIAGTEPVEDKPPGTMFLGLSMDACEEVREIHRPGPRGIVKGFAAQCALDLLRRRLQAPERAHT